MGAVVLGEALALWRALDIAPHEGRQPRLLPRAGFGGALGVDAGNGAEGLVDVVAKRGFGGRLRLRGGCGLGRHGHRRHRHWRGRAGQERELLAHQLHLLRDHLVQQAGGLRKPLR
ncbi:hypothetical protein D9M68_593900 [compost metagenome]